LSDSLDVLEENKFFKLVFLFVGADLENSSLCVEFGDKKSFIPFKD